MYLENIVFNSDTSSWNVKGTFHKCPSKTLSLKRNAPLMPKAKEEARADCCSFLFPLTHASLVIILYLMNGFIYICLLQLPFIALGRRQYPMNMANVKFLLL